MTKYVIGVLIFIAALAAVMLYIGNEPEIVIGSTAEAGFLKFETHRVPWQWAIGFLTFFVVALIGLWSILGWLWRLPRRVKSGVGLRRRNQALEAMEEALIAGAEGDKAKARKKSQKARSLIGSPDLGRMVSAQAAEACGDNEEAITHYKAMLGSERTLATAQRGLAQQLLAQGDLNGAIDHAGKAYEDNKNAAWAFDVLFQAQVSDHQWQAAVQTLELGEKRKHIERDISRRRRAVLQTAEADRLEGAGQAAAARDLAVSAAQESPEFAPAVGLAAKLLKQTGGIKKGAQLIEKAWGKAPHPALALAYRDIFAEATPKAKAKHMRNLYKANPTHRETILLQIEEALKSNDAVTAWSALSPMVAKGTPSARLCTLAAKTETMLKNQQDARVWIERAATAPAEADWSDLDPEGEAFDYVDQDWRRLVFSFGKDGELIHPRYESGAARKKPLDIITEAAPEPAPAKTAELGNVDTADLADRLDNLMDKPKT